MTEMANIMQSSDEGTDETLTETGFSWEMSEESEPCSKVKDSKNNRNTVKPGTDGDTTIPDNSTESEYMRKWQTSSRQEMAMRLEMAAELKNQHRDTIKMCKGVISAQAKLIENQEKANEKNNAIIAANTEIIEKQKQDMRSQSKKHEAEIKEKDMLMLVAKNEITINSQANTISDLTREMTVADAKQKVLECGKVHAKGEAGNYLIVAQTAIAILQREQNMYIEILKQLKITNSMLENVVSRNSLITPKREKECGKVHSKGEAGKYLILAETVIASWQREQNMNIEITKQLKITNSMFVSRNSSITSEREEECGKVHAKGEAGNYLMILAETVIASPQREHNKNIEIIKQLKITNSMLENVVSRNSSITSEREKGSQRRSTDYNPVNSFITPLPDERYPRQSPSKRQRKI